MSVFQTERAGAAPACRTIFQSSRSVRAMHATLRAERSETDSTQCCPQGGEAINVEDRGAALCEIAHDHEARSSRCTEAGAANPRGSTISCGHRPAAGHGYAKAGTPVRVAFGFAKWLRIKSCAIAHGVRLTAPFLNSSVADTARHLSRKQDHVGASAVRNSA
jgi:hypothetical protein